LRLRRLSFQALGSRSLGSNLGAPGQQVMVARHRHLSYQLLGRLLQLIQGREDVGQSEDSAGVSGESLVLFAEKGEIQLLCAGKG